MRRMARRAWKALAALGGGALSLLLFSTAFCRWDFTGSWPRPVARFPVARFLQQLPENLDWLAAFAVLTAAVVPMRAFQWSATLPVPVPFRERYHLLAIGSFVNNAIPGKLGEITRAFLMARTQGFSFTTALGSVAICKLLELYALMLIFAVALASPISGAVSPYLSGLKWALLLMVFLSVLLAWVARGAGRWSRWLADSKAFGKLAAPLEGFDQGLGAARSWRRLSRTGLLSIPPVLFPALGYGLGLTALGVPGGVFAGPLVLGTIALGQIPGLPATIGIYYLLTSWIARSLGAAEDAAAAYAVLTHLTSLLTLITVGAISVGVRRLKWSELRRGSAQAKQALGAR